MRAIDVITLPFARRPLSRGQRVASVVIALTYIALFVSTMAILGPRGDAWWVVAAAAFLVAGFALGRRAARKDFERYSHTTGTRPPPIS